MKNLRYLQMYIDVDPDFSNYSDDSHNGLQLFGPISSINILVGATNSGKSRFMRSLIKTQNYTTCDNDRFIIILQELKKVLRVLSSTEAKVSADISPVINYFFHNWGPRWLEPLFNSRRVKFDPIQGMYDSTFFSTISSNIDTVIEFYFNKRKNDQFSPYTLLGMKQSSYEDMLTVIDILKQDLESKNSGGSTLSQFGHIKTFSLERHGDIEAMLFHWMQLLDIINQIIALETPKRSMPYKIYIPTLRTAVQLVSNEYGVVSHDILGHSVNANYILPTSNDFELFTGGSLYDRIDEEKRSDIAVQRRVKEFEKFLSETFFDSKDVTITSMYSKAGGARNIKIFVEDRFERNLHDVGDGINSLIVLMYRIFMAPDQAWIFIEEPELNLHPGLQRVFLECLLKNQHILSKDLTIFFTTHSNHLLKIALPEYDDVSVFAFQNDNQKKEYFSIRPIHNAQNHALVLLGAHNSSMLLANCGIWVEGPTDRNYIRAYLEAYIKSSDFPKNSRHFIEDVHFAFWNMLAQTYLIMYSSMQKKPQKKKICCEKSKLHH